MKQEINPQESIRANAFNLWMSSPVPMVTLVKTLDVSRIVKMGKQEGHGFNVLLCWCIGKAACGIKEFHVLPEKGKLFHYDKLAVNVIVENSKGGINSCDIPYTDNLQQFCHDYQKLTTKAARECQSVFLDDHMVVGTCDIRALLLPSHPREQGNRISSLHCSPHNICVHHPHFNRNSYCHICCHTRRLRFSESRIKSYLKPAEREQARPKVMDISYKQEII